MVERLAEADSPRGSVVLRRRRDRDRWVYELFVNGTFVMDTAESSTERRLARLCLDHLVQPATVIVGGLGLGYTVAELLDSDRVERIEVVELEPAVVGWLRDGLVPDTATVLHDPRVRTHLADIRPWLEERAPDSADAILLDVDNGPDYLVHAGNTLIYEADCLSRTARILRPGGVLAIWSASRSTALQRRITAVFGNCAAERLTARRDHRELEYVVYTATVTNAAEPTPA